VSTARLLVTSSMMSRDYDGILTILKSSHSDTIGSGSNVEQCVKNQLILLKTLRAEALGVTLPQVK